MILKRFRWFTTLPLLLGLTLLLFPQQSNAVTYTGIIHIDGDVRLDMLLSPPVSTPGDTLSLTVHLANTGRVMAEPEVKIDLPAGVRLDMRELPSGVTANLVNGRLQWNPILTANGESQFSLPLQVETVGVAQVEQELRAVLRQNETEQTASTPIWIGLPPQIRAIRVPPQAAVGQLIGLDADVGGSGPFTFSWHLGDGRRVDVANPSTLYPVAGPFTIYVEVSNPLTTVASQQEIFIVPYPAAHFAATDESVTVGEAVQFENTSGGQPPLLHRWDFGDGTSSTETNPAHAYTAPGIYRVQLTVNNRLKASEAFTLVRVGLPPVADMVATESVPLGTDFIGEAFGDDSVTEFIWDMGDGRFQSGQQISHRYQQTDNYYVRLTAVNEYGRTEVGKWIYAEAAMGTGTIYLPYIANLASGQPNADDPFALDLPDVALDAPFVMQPMTLPDNMSQAEQLLAYINEARRQFDLPELPYVLELGMAAQQHVNDMANYGYTAHIGADGSHPAERLIWHNYTAGYAGEATAWGFQHAYEAVEFWINSPPHRRILLNAQATDVGVGFTTKYDAPNVWYWTAEFGNRYAVADAALLRLQPIPVESELIDDVAVPINPMVTEALAYRWTWPKALPNGYAFTLSLLGETGAVELATVTEPLFDMLYGVNMDAIVVLPGEYLWQVTLRDANGRFVAAGQPLPITFIADPSLVTPTPEPTTTSATPLPSVTPTATPTTVPIAITSTPQAPPPIVVTTTPVP